MRSLFVHSLAVIGCLASGAAFADTCDTTAGNLVTNCGFEADNSATLPLGTAPTGWAVSGAGAAQTNLWGLDSFEPFDGNNDFFSAVNGQGTGPKGADGVLTLTLSQILALPFSSGNYQVSFEIMQDTAPGPSAMNSLEVELGGNVLTDQTNVAPTNGYVLESFTAADITTGELDFLTQNDAGNWFLDDVVVTYVPEPGTFALFGMGLIGLVAAVTRRTSSIQA